MDAGFRRIAAAAGIAAIVCVAPVAARAGQMPETVAPSAGATRLFFGATGRMLPRGEASLTGFGLFGMPVVNMSVSDRVSLAIGAPLPTLMCFCRPVVLVSPKIQVYRAGSTQAAAGVVQLAALGEGGIGLAYAAVTSGSPDAAITLGAGVLYTYGPAHTVGAPIFMIGGERRISSRLVFVSDNYLGPGAGLVSGGVRIEGRRVALDLGVVAPFSVEDFIIVGPVLNLSWRFGRD